MLPRNKKRGFYLIQRLSETLKVVVLAGIETVAYSDTSFLSCATGVILSFAKFQNDAL
jgi:hypothetical protein